MKDKDLTPEQIAYQKSIKPKSKHSQSATKQHELNRLKGVSNTPEDIKSYDHIVKSLDIYLVSELEKITRIFKLTIPYDIPKVTPDQRDFLYNMYIKYMNPNFKDDKTAQTFCQVWVEMREYIYLRKKLFVN